MRVLARSRQLDGKKINTTLIATIGPVTKIFALFCFCAKPTGRETQAIESKAKLTAMLAEGMSVARFNLAHGTRQSHTAALENLRAVLHETGGVCATIVALRGLRV